MANPYFKDKVMQIEKTMIDDRVRVSKVQPSKLATTNGNYRGQFKIYFQMLFYSF